MAAGLFRAVTGKIAEVIFPRQCLGCGIPLLGRAEDGPEFCPECRRATDWLDGAICTRCGIGFRARQTPSHWCGACTLKSPVYDLARAAAAHDGPVAAAVRGFKYRARLGAVDGLAGLMLTRAKELGRPHDLVIPVPLHPGRLRSRGFNQAWLLGRRLALGLGLEADSGALDRVRFTVPQVGLSDVARRRNVKGAFALSNDGHLKGARVILVDDVLTTGATVNECARVLKRGGATWVTVLTVTRAC